MHFKCGNGGGEGLLSVAVFEQVSAVHFSYFAAEVATAYVLIIVAGFNKRLNAHHAFALHFAGAAVTVENEPVAAQQFYGKGIVVFDADAVSKHILAVKRVAVLRLVEGFYSNGDAV